MCEVDSDLQVTVFDSAVADLHVGVDAHVAYTELFVFVVLLTRGDDGKGHLPYEGVVVVLPQPSGPFAAHTLAGQSRVCGKAVEVALEPLKVGQ